MTLGRASYSVPRTHEHAAALFARMMFVLHCCPQLYMHMAHLQIERGELHASIDQGRGVVRFHDDLSVKGASSGATSSETERLSADIEVSSRGAVRIVVFWVLFSHVVVFLVCFYIL